MTENKACIYHFNPTCDYAVGNGTPGWQPKLLLQKMESDLATIPVYYANESDYIVTNKIPTEQFYNYVKKLELQPCKFLLKSSLENIPEPSFEIEKLLPWGWSPAEHKLLNPLKNYCSEAYGKSPVFNWKPQFRDLYSKKFALEILQKLITEIDSDFVIKNEQVGKVCYTKSEINGLIGKWNKLMIKAPWSSSGRGLQPITKVPVHEKVWEKISGIIHDQGYVLVEPLLNKAFDLAFQFELEKGKINYLGISNFTTDKKGQYQGNFLNRLPPDLNSEVQEFIVKIPDLIVPPLIKTVENSALASNYEGNFGVDTLIYRDENNKLKVNPCLEINLRKNMGLLSLHLEKLIHSNKLAMYRTYYNPQKSFFDFVREMEIKFPLSILNGKIKKGFYPLTDFEENTLFGAYLFVE